MHDLSFNAFTAPAGCTATLVAIGEAGELSIKIGCGNETVAMRARTTVTLGEADIGREVLIIFDNDRPESPVVIGCLQDAGTKPAAALNVEADGESVIVSAEKTLKFVCGQASIRMSQSGKIEIRGTHIVSRSIGPNKIKGGSVQLN